MPMWRGYWQRLVGDPTRYSLAVLLAGLLVTLAAWWAAERQASRFAQEQFTEIAAEVEGRIVKRMYDYEQILRGGVGMFEAAEEVTRAEWRNYVERLNVDDYYPGILGIGFSLRVPQDRLGAHQQSVRRQGYPDYEVKPPGNRAVTYPIVFLEPFARRNREAFGFDMFSEPVRHAAMARARDTGKPSLSGRVTLVQEIDEDVQAGTLLYLPLYSGSGDPGSEMARRKAIVGFVYSPFRMGDLMRGILGERLQEIGVRLFDGTAKADNLLFQAGFDDDSRFMVRRVVDMYGRKWVLEVSAGPALRADLANHYPMLVLGAGSVISLLLMWLARAALREKLRNQALLRANADLGQARVLAEQAKAVAEAAVASKSKFLAAASHDIRQPVQSITLLLDVLRQKVGGHPAGSLIPLLDASLDALRMLLNGLLDVSKLDAGVVDCNKQPVPLGGMLQRLADEYRIRAAEKGLSLHVVPTTAWGLTDLALLERILRNLLENAVRYTHQGKILLGCRRGRGAVCIQVADTGIGIPPHQQDQIFQEFHQVGNPERDRSQGLGLGLAIVRRLSQLLGHDIAVRSQLGRGSCFHVTLSEVAPPQERAESGGSLEILEGRGVLVLVVDDERLLREGFRHLIESWGYQVVTAGTVAEAVAAVRGESGRLGLIVADYRLRDRETGTEAIRRVCGEVGRDIPAIIVTGDTAPDRIIEIERSGYQILHKPVAPADLRSAVVRKQMAA